MSKSQINSIYISLAGFLMITVGSILGLYIGKHHSIVGLCIMVGICLMLISAMKLIED